MRTFALDLRQRVLTAALQGSDSEQAVADRFGVSKGFVQKLKRRWRSAGTAAPVEQRRGPAPKLSDDDRVALATLVEERPDATSDELRRVLAEQGRPLVSRRTLDRALVALGLTLKKRRSEPTSGPVPMWPPSAGRS
jgi:transposase